jgi:hypothetical protein
LAAENVPVVRERIPVPDISRIADEPPHIEDHYTVMFVREPVRAAFSAGFTTTAISTVTWRVPPVELSPWTPTTPDAGSRR